MAAKNGGPAFPVSYISDGNPGMTLRDYFAGQALVGWIASLSARHEEPGYSDVAAAEEAARLAYVAADAMLAAREEVAADE